MNSTSPSPDSELFDYRKWPNCLAALMMSLNCFLGFISNGAIIYVFAIDSRQRQSSFNMMCAIRAFNSIVSLTTSFLLVYIPKALLGRPVLPPWLESFLVCLSLNFYLFNEFQSIYISLNRFVAIYLPRYYEKICGFRGTLLVQLLLFANRGINVGFETVERVEGQKYIAFSPEYLMFTALEVSGDGMVLKVGIMFLVALGANLLTFCKISMFYMKSGPFDDKEKVKRIRNNAWLFLQTVLQDFLFFIDNFFTYNLSGLLNHRFWFFICASFVWQTMHVVDGFIMMLFNDRLFILRNAFFTSTQVSSSAAEPPKVAPNRHSMGEVA